MRAVGVRSLVVLLVGLTVAVGSVAATPASRSATAAAATLPAGLPRVLDGAVTGFTRMGPDIVVAGTFSQVEIVDPVTQDALTTLTRPGLFAYDAATGLFDPGFLPSVNGGVLAVAGDAGGVYVGGDFTSVNGLPHRKIVHLEPDGSVDPTFSANVDNRVQALALDGNRLFVGGQFTLISPQPSLTGGVSRTRLAQLDATTGQVSASFTLPLTGTAGAGGGASVQTLAVSPDGSRLLVAHTAQRIAGQPRYGVGVIDIGGATATLDPFHTDLWSSRLAQTGGLVRVTSAAWGPDSTWFVVTNTGGDVPPINDCVQRFDLPASPTTQPVDPTWITRQFDSSYSSAVGPDGSVYVGGHFQFTEAPGAADPYPGDPDVNYGGGLATQGARTLGQQVVYRPQVAALDPTTGQATNWWSSAAGQKGVTALLVTGGRVLIGSDGAWIDRRLTGRAGSVPAADAPAPAGTTSTVTSPGNGANLNVGPVTLGGAADASDGVSDVQVQVSRNKGEWLQADGTWGPTPRVFEADLASPGATHTGWQVPGAGASHPDGLQLTDPGSYTVFVKALGSGGSKQANPTVWHLLTNDPTNAPPTTRWTSPAPGQSSFPSSTFTVTGTATDPDGVAGVALTFYNQDLHSFVSPDGSVDPFVTSQADLASPGAPSTTWSLRVTLPVGHYTAQAKGTDGLGTTDPRGTEEKFALFPGNRAPTVSIASPRNGARVGAFTVSGRAGDDRAVDRVLVRVADLRYGLGAQPTGTYGVAQWLRARLADPGRASTTWSVRVPRLRPGTYRVTAMAVDRTGLAGPQRQVTVLRWPAGVTAEPATVIASPTEATRFLSLQPPLAIPLSGTASYRPGVTSVTYSVFDTSTGRYLQSDGTLAVTPYSFPTTLGSGRTSRGWKATAVLPHAGTWRLDAVAHGPRGMVDSSTAGSRTMLYVYPGDDDPSVLVISPAPGTSFPGPRRVTVSGRALDDVGVLGVQVLVRNRTGSEGLRPSLTLGPHPSWVDAFVTNVGGLASNYNLVTPRLPKGTWWISVRAVDSVGQPTASPITRQVRIG